MVALAAGALLPLVGVSSAAPPAGVLESTHSTAVRATSAALTTFPLSTVAQGGLVTLIAAVTPSTFAGTVQFKDGTVNIGIPTIVANGTALVTTSSAMLATGSHELSVVFTPADPAAYGPSMSPAVSLTVTGQEQQSAQSLDKPNVFEKLSETSQKLPAGPLGIPGVMLDAYQRAERTMAAAEPACHLPWTMLAGIGQMESGHASGGRVDAAGNTLGSILGPELDGSSDTAAIADTDHGTLDADQGWDRAVGPMQFIPASWRGYGAGNPNNIYDSTLAAGRYLCAGGTDLSDPAQQVMAIFRYNHSATYVANVLLWAQGYQTGVLPTPSEPGPVTESSPAVMLAAARTQQAPVVAQLDAPQVAQLDPPAVAQLDAQPATSPAATSSPQSLDTPTTDSAVSSVPLG
jgi:membrane-bound lytic murein transglycosylase B